MPIANVLAERYASPAIKDIWSTQGRILLERDFWIAVMKAQKDLGVPIPARGDQGLRTRQGRHQPRVHPEARAGDAARRQGAAGGVLGAGGPAVHPPRADQPRPDGERRAAADLPFAQGRPFQGGGRASRARPAGRGAPRPDDHRPHPQRAGAADNAGQAAGDVRPGAAHRPGPAGKPDRALSGARPERGGGHAARPAHAAGRPGRPRGRTRRPDPAPPRVPGVAGGGRAGVSAQPRFRRGVGAAISSARRRPVSRTRSA